MKTTRVTFKIMNEDEEIPPTNQEIHCRMIFDIKLDDLWRNGRFATGGNTTDTPHVVTYQLLCYNIH
jgi:hypothetical protein